MQSLPASLADSARVNWHITSWCNYTCAYCPVMVFHRRSATGEKQAHAFDHYPVEQWLEAFGRFPEKEINVSITGGEPFLDRQNFKALLAGFSRMPHIRVNVCTNGYWDPAYFQDLEKSRLTLVVSSHSSQSSFADFLQRLRAIRDAGFTIARVNDVLAPENIQDFEDRYRQLTDEGFFVNVGAMTPSGVYLSRTSRTQEELELLAKYNPPLDLRYKLLEPATKGRPCFYPALSYDLKYDGSISAACMATVRNLVTDGPPRLSREAVACPQDVCVGCTGMYRSLADEPANLQPANLFAVDDIVDEMKAYRASLTLTEYQATARQLALELDERERAREAQLPMVPLHGIGAALPTQPIFGYVDSIDGNHGTETRSGDRLWLSGWIASLDHGAPVKEVRLRIDGHTIGVVRDFYPRPDVAAHFARSNLMLSGWRTLVFVPALRRGNYELTVEATDSGGISGAIDPWPIRIGAT